MVFNTVIAAFLTLLRNGDFPANLIYSQSIGLSIFVTVHAIMGIRGLSKTEWGAFVIAVPLGSGIGILIANTLTGHSLLQLVVEHPLSLVTLFVIALVFGTVASYYFYSRAKLAETNEALREESLRRIANDQRLTETHLKLLQAQIEPHFLFNTLSNVLSLIDDDPGNAKHMLENLTHYLRASLQRTRTDKNTLGEELALLSSYLAIQAIRMGDRLSYRFDIPEELHSLSLPPLLIQPLVENAIKHGLEPKPEGGAVFIQARIDDGMLVIEVNDSGQGFRNDSGTGVGLRNIRDRLQGLYNKKGHLLVQENRPHGVRAQLTIPLETAAHEEML